MDIESISPLANFIFEMTETKNIKVFDLFRGSIVLFILLAIVSFSLAFVFEMIFPNIFLTRDLTI